MNIPVWHEIQGVIKELASEYRPSCQVGVVERCRCRECVVKRAESTRRMKVITIKQPWAWLIMHAHKDVENRSWYTPHRGPLAIHASARIDREEFDSAREIAEPLGIIIPDEIETAAILGTVELRACIRRYQSPWAFGPWHFILKNPELLDAPIPAKGQLGLWDGPDIPRRNR